MTKTPRAAWRGRTQCAVVLLALLSSVLFGMFLPSPARAAERQFAPLTLVVNGEKRDLSTVLLRGNDVLVPRRELERAGLTNLPTKADEVVDGEAYVSLRRLAPLVRYKIDEQALALNVEAPAEYFGTTVISLRREPPDDMVQYSDTGFFFNYAPRLIDFQTPAMNGEAGLSVDGHLLSSSASYDTTNGVVRGLTNLTIDEPADLRRWVLGDALVTSSDPLAGSLFMGGVSVSRNFSLNPNFVAFPTQTRAGTALTASTLEVYVNGVLVRREPISPGRFRIDDLAVPTGAGNTRYVLRDAFGREQQGVAPYYGSQGALARGVTDYGVAVGYLRESFGVESFDYGPLAMSSRYRAGVSDHVTLGARVEAPLHIADFGVSAGPSATLLTPAGQFNLSAGGSYAPDGNYGVAGSASYTYQSPGFAGGVAARSLSDHYYTLGMSPFDDRPRFGGTAFVAVPIGSRMALNSTYGVALSELGTTASVSTHVALSLTKNIRLDVTASRTRYPDGTSPYEAFGTLSIALGGGVFTSLSAQVLGSNVSATVDVSKPAPAGPGIGYRAALTHGERTAFSGSVQGQAQYGEGRVYLVALDDELHSEVSVAGGVVVVPAAGVFFTRPVQGGYAVIQVPGANNVRGYLNGNEMGRTDASGDLLVPNLLPYYENRLSISDADLPPDYRIEGGDHVAAAPYRGPAVVHFEAKRSWFVRGTLVVRRAGRNVVPSYGEVSVKSGERRLTSPIAREGQFEFEDLGAGKYKARLEYAEGTCEVTLVVPEKEGTVSELGTIVCVAP